MPPRRHRRVRRALCRLNIPQHIAGSLEASPVPSSVALLPLPAQATGWQGGGKLTAHSGCTPTAVRLKAALCQREHAVELDGYYTPRANTQFSGGGKLILRLLPT